MKWVYARGTSLFPLILGIIVSGGFIIEFLGMAPKIAAPPDSFPVADLAAAQQLGHEQMRSGLILEGATTILEALRTQSLDDVSQMHEIEASLQLLAFCMAALMPDETLPAFYDSLNETLYPIDALIIIEFHKEFKDYAAWRPVMTLDDAQFPAYLEHVCASAEPVLKIGALRTYFDREWREDGDDAAMVATLNALAVESAGVPAMQNALRSLVHIGAAGDVDQAEFLVTDPAWNAPMASLIDADPVAAIVQEAAADPDPSAVLQEEAVANPDPDVRDWCVANLVPESSTANDSAETIAPDVEACLETVIAADDAISAKSAERAPVSPEVARAQYLLFADAVNSGDIASALSQVDALWEQERARELPDLNLYEGIPRKLGFLGYEVLDHGSKEEAIALFERLATMYPNSFLAQDHLKTAEFLRQAPI